MELIFVVHESNHSNFINFCSFQFLSLWSFIRSGFQFCIQCGPVHIKKIVHFSVLKMDKIKNWRLFYQVFDLRAHLGIYLMTPPTVSGPKLVDRLVYGPYVVYGPRTRPRTRRPYCNESHEIAFENFNPG